MSDFVDDDLDLDTDDETTDIRSLRRAANASKKLKAELNAIRRELAFAKAGLPLDDPKMTYFIKGYEGDLEPDLIREAAIQAGFVSMPQQTADAPQQSQEAFSAQQRVMAASAGAVAEDVTEAAAIARMEAAMAEGGLEAMLDIARQYGLPTSVDI